MQIYNSLRELEIAAQAIDAGIELFVSESPYAVAALPVPVGKQLIKIQAGRNNFISIWNISGAYIGIKFIGMLGGKFVMEPGTVLPLPVLSQLVTTHIFDSVKALEDFLKITDVTATVVVYNPEQVVVTGLVVFIVAGPTNKVTVVRGTLPNILFVLNVGMKYLVIES